MQNKMKRTNRKHFIAEPAEDIRHLTRSAHIPRGLMHVEGKKIL